jgi:hypothetical protein
MTESQARSWAYAAAAAGVIANTLFIAFYASFAVQRFAEPRGVTAITGARRGALLAYGWLLLAYLLAGLTDNAALYGGLHALDGLLSLGIAGFAYASARRWRSRMARS